MSDKLIISLATFFYLGKAPKFPGTVGTLGAIPVVLLLFMTGKLFYMLGAFLLTIFAVFVAQSFETRFGGHDNSEIVIDEVAGFVVAMTWLPWYLKAILAPSEYLL